MDFLDFNGILIVFFATFLFLWAKLEMPVVCTSIKKFFHLLLVKYFHSV